nr:MAG TPA: hypothetical protein [Caudoviricetes sp.]
MLYGINTFIEVHNILPLYIFVVIYNKIKYIGSVFINNILVLFSVSF